jgi:hypothetical protein
LQDWTGGDQLSGVDFHRNLVPALDLSGRYATDVFTEEAVNIIETHDLSSPLFLYLAHLACHSGNIGKLLEAPQDAIKKFGHIIEPNRRTFAGKVAKFPRSVVLTAVRMSVLVFWVVTPCGLLCRYQRLGWRQYVSPKHWYLPHGIITQKTDIGMSKFFITDQWVCSLHRHC